ncbi:MAG: restriction endonuclease subunit S [Chromatiales bacterium]|nr:restriction endonuclease subunit S [Gammaproteobacteria bacterium]
MVPDGWEKTKLGVLSRLITSGSRDWARYYSDSGSLFLRMTNLPRDGINLDLSSVKYVSVNQDSADGKRTKLKVNDILISITAELGKIGFVANDLGPAYINQHTALVRIDPDCACPKYIAFALSSYKLNRIINRLNDAGAKAGLNLPTIKAIPLVIPSIMEQTKIAQILSIWDKAIETTEKLIENSKTQKKALMQQLLTGKKRFPRFSKKWLSSKIGEVCLINPRKPKKPTNSRVSFVAMGSVSEDARLRYSEERQYGDVEKGFTSFRNNDVLVAKITPCFENGKGAYVEKLINGIGFGSTEFHVIRAKKGVCSKFIYHLTNSFDFRVRGGANMQGSAGQKRVPTDYLRSYKFNFPEEYKEQKMIADVLDAMDSLMEILSREVRTLTNQKKALMQQLLTGKRRVKLDKR